MRARPSTRTHRRRIQADCRHRRPTGQNTSEEPRYSIEHRSSKERDGEKLRFGRSSEILSSGRDRRSLDVGTEDVLRTLRPSVRLGHRHWKSTLFEEALLMSFSGRSLCAILRNLFFIVLLTNVRFAAAQVQFQPYQVHIGYVIPTNRQAQPNAVSDLQAEFPAIQSWYADQMNRYGFGPKTFQFETLADGVTPKVYTTKAAITDTQMRQNIFSNTIGSAAFGVGPSNNPDRPKTVWASFSEEHVELSDGSVLRDTSLGSGGGGDTGGVTVQSSNLLPFENPSMLSNTANYPDVTVPAFGSFPMAF